MEGVRGGSRVSEVSSEDAGRLSGVVKWAGEPDGGQTGVGNEWMDRWMD